MDARSASSSGCDREPHTVNGQLRFTPPNHFIPPSIPPITTTVRTLVVDDSRTIRRILRDVLEEIGYEVLEADNGEQALHTLDSERQVDLVLTDWDMPVMDGVALLRSVRAHATHHALPVVMVTQNNRPERVREAMVAGASGYITKPFSRNGLIEKLAALGCTPQSTHGVHRVLVVDDAAVVRRMLAQRIEADPELELAGTAKDGEAALALVDADCPDIVVLDVEMPGMDGLETLARMRARFNHLPVIMYSVLTERGARATLDALSRGAVDYVTKPQAAGDREAAASQIDDMLLARIKAICGERSRRARPHRHRSAAAAARTRARSRTRRSRSQHRRAGSAAGDAVRAAGGLSDSHRGSRSTCRRSSPSTSHAASIARSHCRCARRSTRIGSAPGACGSCPGARPARSRSTGPTR